LNGGAGRLSVSPSAGVAMGWFASITPANRGESRRAPTGNSRTEAQKGNTRLFSSIRRKTLQTQIPCYAGTKTKCGRLGDFRRQSASAFWALGPVADGSLVRMPIPTLTDFGTLVTLEKPGSTSRDKPAFRAVKGGGTGQCKRSTFVRSLRLVVGGIRRRRTIAARPSRLPHAFRRAASRACEIPRSPRESAVDAPRGASGDRMRRNRAPQGRRVL
jgi:hypothetical protein